MNDELRNDDRLRALCLSGSLPIAEYVKALTDAGFDLVTLANNHALDYGPDILRQTREE